MSMKGPFTSLFIFLFLFYFILFYLFIFSLPLIYSVNMVLVPFHSPLHLFVDFNLFNLPNYFLLLTSTSSTEHIFSAVSTSTSFSRYFLLFLTPTFPFLPLLLCSDFDYHLPTYVREQLQSLLPECSKWSGAPSVFFFRGS